MIVHTILLSKRDQVNRITSELHDGNIILIDFTPLTSDQETLHKVLAELERAIADVDGDLVGVSQKWILATPNGVRVSREKIKSLMNIAVIGTGMVGRLIAVRII